VVGGDVTNGCNNAAQSAAFTSCCNEQGSACEQLSTYSSFSTAPQELQCQCAFQMEACENQNVPCQSSNAVLGSSSFLVTECISGSTCSGSLLNAFHTCCTASGSACATDPSSCECAQQVQACQATNYGCQNVGLGTSGYLQDTCSTCPSESLDASFQSCCTESGSACATLNSAYQYGNAPAAMQCACSLQVQGCQRTDTGCQNAVQGSAYNVSNACSSCTGATIVQFNTCMNQGACAVLQNQYPYGGASNAQLCACAQQMQQCQSSWVGCSNDLWGTQAFLSTTCAGATPSTAPYTTLYLNGYHGYNSAAATMLSIVALLVSIALAL